MQPSDEIKEKLDIVDFIREFIPLKAAGMNFRANCPFHREKTPSFMVSPDKQIWHCFGCGKGGDIFAFIMEMDGLNFVEALRLLAPKAGVTLRRQDPKLSSERNQILDILDLSRRYYNKVLREGPSAKAARKYLRERGLTEETIEEWQIGYSPDGWENVSKLLKQKGYKENEIFLSGMSVKNERNNSFYDRFRGRIMFPIQDINSNPVGFSARVSPEKEANEKMGKYINSPQTVVYDKSKIIFGLDKAKLEIKSKDLAILVEGQMDVISAHQAGYKNVVASSGTALTSDQVKLLKRYSQNIALAFDPDEAGRMAADRGIREASKEEMNIKVIKLPEGRDPDDCICHDPDAWERAVDQAKPVMEYYFDKTFFGLNMDKTEDRRQAARVLLPILASLGNKIELEIWLKKLAEKIDVSEEVLRESLPRPKERKIYKEKEDSNKELAQKIKPPQIREEKLSELLLAIILKQPANFGYASNHLQTEELKGENNQALYKDLIFYYNNVINSPDRNEVNTNDWLDYNEFKNWISEYYLENEKIKESQLALLDRLVFLGERDYYELEDELLKNEMIKIVMNLKKYYLSMRLKEIEKLIALAEEERNTGQTKELLAEFKILTDEMRAMSDE